MGTPMRLLYVGESWQGSCARSLREALQALRGVHVREVDEDHFLPRHSSLPLRIFNRMLRPFQRRELEREVRRSLPVFRPNAVVVYKGMSVEPGLLEDMRRAGIPSVNVFPDPSPHGYGARLRGAIGRYDLVISTKSFHPPRWRSVYGYSNACVCVPHGYDAAVHMWNEPAPADKYDVALCATWRPEYHRLMLDFARECSDEKFRVAVGGHGWTRRKQAFPTHWTFVGTVYGRAYGEFLRSAKIVIAPVGREISVHGVRQPGDEDTTRTYELAAASCFFVHQRTDLVRSIYDETSEVPMWSDARDLAALSARWLPESEARKEMAARAHARAVPAYSIQERAKAVLAHIAELIHRYQRDP